MTYKIVSCVCSVGKQQRWPGVCRRNQNTQQFGSPPYELPLHPSCLVSPFPVQISYFPSPSNVSTLCSTFLSPQAPALELSRRIVTRKCWLKNSFFYSEGCICMPRPARYLATTCTHWYCTCSALQLSAKCSPVLHSAKCNALLYNALLCNAFAFTSSQSNVDLKLPAMLSLLRCII